MSSPTTDPARPNTHIPVLLDEVIGLLAPAPGETAVDCTAGLGGHASALAARLGSSGTLILNDLDSSNLTSAAAHVRAQTPGNTPRIIDIKGSFADVPRKLAASGLGADLVLADLGFSSNQIEDASRGFSFMRDGPLDMRLDPTGPTSASDLVNTLSEAELAELIQEYGEDRLARRIAQKLVAHRQGSPIQTTGQLASIVRSVVGSRGAGGIDPATRTFQALRIAVNDELGSLRSLLESVGRAAGKSGTWLKPTARIGIISFHSLEDRLVKNAFGELVRKGAAEALTKKPVEAGERERVDNPRSRSAKLRVIRLTTSSAV